MAVRHGRFMIVWARAAMTAIFAFTLAAAAQAGGDTAPSGLPVPRFVSLKVDRVNVRGGPDKDHDVSWIYTRVGWPVEIIAEFENWRRIRDSDGSEGWVYHSLLSGKRMAAVQLKSKTDLAPLHDACAPLPIAPADLLRTRQALALMPQICALLLVGVTGLALRHTLHLAPLLGFVLTSSAFHAVLVLKSSARRSGQPQDEAAWWLVALVIVVAFASEVGL